MMEKEKCYKLKGLRMGEISAVSPIPSPRRGDESHPSSTVRQREREKIPSSSSLSLFSLWPPELWMGPNHTGRTVFFTQFMD